jgi:hypothetical protein
MKRHGLSIILTLATLLFSSTQVVCQISVGIVAGPDVNFLDAKKFNSPINRLGSLIGYHTGVAIQYEFTKKLSIVTNVELIRKDYSICRKDSINTSFQFRNIFMQLPLVFQLKVLDMDKWSLSISGGGFVSRWRSSHVTGIIPDAFNSYVDGQSNTRVNWDRINTSYQFMASDVRYEYGLTGGMRLAYQMNQALTITSSVSYYRSLTNLRSDESPARYNNTIALGFGVLYKITKR